MTWETAPHALKVCQAAELLCCSDKTVYRRLEKGEWASFSWKIGSAWRIRKDGLREHLEQAPMPQPADDPMPQTHRARFDALVERELKGAAA